MGGIVSPSIPGKIYFPDESDSSVEHDPISKGKIYKKTHPFFTEPVFLTICFVGKNKNKQPEVHEVPQSGLLRSI